MVFDNRMSCPTFCAWSFVFFATILIYCSCFGSNTNFIFPGYIKVLSMDPETSSELAANSHRYFDKTYRHANVKPIERDILWNQSEFGYFNFVYLIYYVYDDIKLGFVLHINYQFIYLIKRKCFFNCPPCSRVLKWPLFILYSCWTI